MARHTPPKKTAKKTHKTATGAKKIKKKTAAPVGPIFAQPAPSPDPTSFKDPVTDQKYQELLVVEAVRSRPAMRLSRC